MDKAHSKPSSEAPAGTLNPPAFPPYVHKSVQCWEDDIQNFESGESGAREVPTCVHLCPEQNPMGVWPGGAELSRS